MRAIFSALRGMIPCQPSQGGIPRKRRGWKVIRIAIQFVNQPITAAVSGIEASFQGAGSANRSSSIGGGGGTRPNLALGAARRRAPSGTIGPDGPCRTAEPRWRPTRTRARGRRGVRVSAAAPEYEVYVEPAPQGLLHRLFTTYGHALGLAFGALASHLRELPDERRRGARYRLESALNGLTRHLVDRELVGLPFEPSLRRRLERLGATYVKLGQLLALRQDLLPERVTRELAQLLDRLPAIPFARFPRAGRPRARPRSVRGSSPTSSPTRSGPPRSARPTAPAPTTAGQ